MRDKNYRRKQEAKHYKARLNLLSPSTLAELFNKDIELSENEKRVKNRLLKKLKTGDLKYGLVGKWDKLYSSRNKRHFQKLVDYQLPNKYKYLDRKHINPQAKGYNGDSMEDYYWWLLHGEYNPRIGKYELDIYPDE